MATPAWLLAKARFEELTKGATKEEADAKLMSAAPELDETPAVEALPNMPVNEGSKLVRVPVPEVNLKSPEVPQRSPLDFSPVGGHVDPIPPDAPSQDWGARNTEARGQADDMRLISGLGRAGERINSALSGTRSDDSAYDAIDAQAKDIETRVPQDIRIDELARKYRMGEALKDPNHPINQRARAATPKAYAAMLGPDVFNTATAEFLEKRFPVLREALKIATADEKALWEQQMSSFKMDNDNQKTMATLAGSADQRNINATTAEALAAHKKGESGLDKVDERWTGQQQEQLGKETSKLSDPAAGLKGLEDAYPGIVTKGVFPKDAGAGLVDRALLAIPGGVGTWLASPKGIRFKRLVDLSKAAYQQARSGMAVSEGEMRRIDEFFAGGWMSNPEQLGIVLNAVYKGFYAKLKDTQKGFEAADAMGRPVFSGYQGMKYTDPFWSAADGGTGQSPAAPEASAPAKPRQVTMPDGSVWEELPNGEAKMLRPPTRIQ